MNSNSKGVMGESYVSTLATKTFLSYWCYLNPHDELGDKKEICDLLILFKNICIICQVKNYEFKNNHERYFRKTVESASLQIQGAERKLFNLNRDIYFKHPDKGLVKFEKEKYLQIVRLIIHLGEGIEYQHIGQLSKTNNEFIHILGKEDLEYLLKELNTISDFVDYLNAREALSTKIEKVMILGKEKDLLGLYLRIKPHFHEFINKNEEEFLMIDMEKSWEEFENKRAEAENEDILLKIEGLIYDWVNTDLIQNEKSRIVAEELMSLNREERRYFATAFLNFLFTYSNKDYKRIIRRNISLNQIGYVFLYYPIGYTHEHLHQLMLIAADGYALHLNYEIVNYIVIGISEKENPIFLYVDLSDLKGNDSESLKKILNHLGWFQEENMQYVEIDLNKKTKNSR